MTVNSFVYPLDLLALRENCCIEFCIAQERASLICFLPSSASGATLRPIRRLSLYFASDFEVQRSKMGP